VCIPEGKSVPSDGELESKAVIVTRTPLSSSSARSIVLRVIVSGLSLPERRVVAREISVRTRWVGYRSDISLVLKDSERDTP